MTFTLNVCEMYYDSPGLQANVLIVVCNCLKLCLWLPIISHLATNPQHTNHTSIALLWWIIEAGYAFKSDAGHFLILQYDAASD